MSTPVQIMLTLLFAAIAVGAIIFLRYSIKKENINFITQNIKSNTLSLEQMNKLVTSRIMTANKNTVFSLLQCDISNADTHKRTVGEEHYEASVNQVINRIQSVLPAGVKFCKQKEDSVLLFVNSKLTLLELNNLCKIVLFETMKTITLFGSFKVNFDVNLAIVSYPEAGINLEEIKNNLDLCMMTSKRKGINQFMVFDRQIKNEQSKEYQFFKEVKNAIENKEFMLYYQPIVDLNTMEVFGAESLLRWNHKTKGVLPASKFMDMLEHSGDINYVGLWAFDKALSQLTTWRQQYPDKLFKVSVNLSIKQILNSDLVDEFRKILKRFKIEAKDICLEFSEFKMFDRMDAINENINKLKTMGFVIAIDNYGSDPTSLSFMDTLQVDIFKISRSFIMKSKENKMIQNIINMIVSHAKENNISVVAEGVEDTAVLEDVKAMGIQYGQGYFFSPPKTPSELISDVVITPWKQEG